jgi:hypothetical protein
MPSSVLVAAWKPAVWEVSVWELFEGGDPEVSWLATRVAAEVSGRIVVSPRSTAPPNCAVELSPQLVLGFSKGSDGPGPMDARPTPAKPTNHSPTTSLRSSDSMP